MPQRIPLDALGRKRCGHCGIYKPLNEFQKSARAVDGVTWQCKTCAKIARHKQYVENPEYYSAYREAKREKARQYAHDYYQKNGDEVRRKNRQYRIDTPEQQKAYKKARKARKRNNGGMFTAAEWRALKAHYHHTCLCCGRVEPEIKLTPDHVVPLVHGGSSEIENIQPLCYSCNSSKQDKIIDYRH